MLFKVQGLAASYDAASPLFVCFSSESHKNNHNIFLQHTDGLGDVVVLDAVYQVLVGVAGVGENRLVPLVPADLGISPGLYGHDIFEHLIGIMLIHYTFWDFATYTGNESVPLSSLPEVTVTFLSVTT